VPVHKQAFFEKTRKISEKHYRPNWSDILFSNQILDIFL
jgi:hypothetical protein